MSYVKTISFCFIFTTILAGSYVYSDSLKIDGSSIASEQSETMSVTNQLTSANNKGSIANNMEKAYELSDALVKDRLIQENSDNKVVLDSISDNDLVVVQGTYDHIHTVLDFLKLPYVKIRPNDIMSATLEPHQTIFVNCPGSFPANAAKKLAEFVASGGQLITTDWALKHVIEVGFPDTIKHNGKMTADEVVEIKLLTKDDYIIKGFFDEETKPVWWLEASSYPIQILDKEKVSVLVASAELKQKYGETPVIVKFEHGEGVVYHMISHFYLQRTETRDAKQQQNSAEYAKIKGASERVQQQMEQEGSDINYGDVQSATTNAEVILRSVIQQKNKANTELNNK